MFHFVWFKLSLIMIWLCRTSCIFPYIWYGIGSGCIVTTCTVCPCYYTHFIFIKISDYICMTHTSISHAAYYLDEQWDIVRRILWRSNLNLTHTQHICMHKGEIIHARTHISSTRAFPFKNVLTAPKAEQCPECVSLLCALLIRP